MRGLQKKPDLPFQQSGFSSLFARKGGGPAVIKNRVDLHHRESGRQVRFVNPHESILFIESVRGQKFVGSAKKYIRYAPLPDPSRHGLQQALGGSVIAAAKACIDKHFTQGDLLVADIEQSHRTHDLAVAFRDPEVAVSLLVEPGNRG